jgi:mannose-6-phosphate isomerase
MKNPIKNYAWGSKTYLSRLLEQGEQSQSPQAELWMGTHPQGISQIKLNDQWIGLERYISNNPDAVLGKRIARQYDNKLPYLFKILAIAKPLSIQVHPDKNQAASGFARENQQHIPLSAPHRNYKDPSHKPELVCALTPLWAMCGFRSYTEIQKNFMPFANIVTLCQSGQTIFHFFNQLMLLDQTRKNQLISAAVQYAHSFTDTAHWEWVIRLQKHFPNDIGVLAPLFLNTLYLKPGEALFLPPGMLHAYLDGNAVEIMCNSDNVIRGGLTIKHIDVEALLDTVLTKSMDIVPMRPQMGQSNEFHYHIPINNFSLTRYDVWNNYCQKISVSGPEILLCTKGNIQIHQDKDILYLKQGMSAFVSHAAKAYSIEGNGIVYKAFTRENLEGLLK